MPFPIGAAIGGAVALGKAIFGGGQRRAAKKINPVWEQYKESPYARQQLGIAQQLFGGRMAGAAEMEGNIAANQASTVSNFQRGATDAAQLLALAGLSQGQSNEAYSDLAIKELQNKQMMLGSLNSAYGNLINEGDKVYQSKLAKYQMDMAQKQALLSGGAQNIFSGLSDISSLAIYGDAMGWFKKKQN